FSAIGSFYLHISTRSNAWVRPHAVSAPSIGSRAPPWGSVRQGAGGSPTHNHAGSGPGFAAFLSRWISWWDCSREVRIRAGVGVGAAHPAADRSATPRGAYLASAA